MAAKRKTTASYSTKRRRAQEIGTTPPDDDSGAGASQGPLGEKCWRCGKRIGHPMSGGEVPRGASLRFTCAPCAKILRDAAKPENAVGHGHRPTKCTAENIETAIVAIRMGGFKETVAGLIGVTPTTVSEWLHSEEFNDREPFESFRRAVNETESSLELSLSGVVMRAARGYVSRDKDGNEVIHPPDPRMAHDALQTRFSRRWGKNQSVEVTGAGGGPVQIDAAAGERVMGKLARLAAATGAGAVPGESDQEGKG